MNVEVSSVTLSHSYTETVPSFTPSRVTIAFYGASHAKTKTPKLG